MVSGEKREMSLDEFVNTLPKCHRANKEYRNLLAGIKDAQMDGVVISNIETMKAIHERTMRKIIKMCEQSMNAHPHYEDSFPEYLEVLESHEDQKTKAETDRRAKKKKEGCDHCWRSIGVGEYKCRNCGAYSSS